uniref:Uncharacterized protein n=1 Tax=Ciona intestinalis TaxID=7719 RepID=H2XUR9_CIOIN
GSSCSERLFTNVTFEWLLTSVNYLVDPYSLFCGERFITNVAFVRLFPCVDTLMGCQMSLSKISFVTFITLEWFNVVVDKMMYF